MATVCAFCGQELPRVGDVRFCTHCGTVVPNLSSESPDAQVDKHDAPPAQDRTPVSPNFGWQEQLAKQPPARAAQPQNPPATPWLGLPGGSDAGNVTPWVGLDNETPKSSAAASVSDPQPEDFPTAIISSAASAADEIDQMPTAQLQTNLKPQRPATMRPLPVSDISLAGRHFETQAAGVAATKSQRAPRRQARPVLFGIVATIVILVVAVGIWLMLAQPFAVSAATNPTQTTTSAPLGLVITYPAAWKATQTATVLALTDSSDTDQMKITQSNSANIDQASYLKQQAAALDMTDAKAGSAISFAGSSWQQTQGDFVINGADYIGTIYVTTHNNQLYTLIQTAPKVTFQAEEKLIFAPARTSLRFN